jgi:phosphopantothenoylcysteine decarboxylase / phosphopantothenate---cysteine ligase
MKILITAGATRQYIDPVRFISNASSGKMGLALAKAALTAGHKVTLITTVDNSKLKTNDSRLTTIQVETAQQMFKAVKQDFPGCDCLIMAAAVADYTPVKIAKTKIKKSSKSLTIKLKPTPDILKWAGSQKLKNQILIGFALEDKNLRRNAEKKLIEKNLDMIVANSPAAVGADESTVLMKIPGQAWLKLAEMKKATIARYIIRQIQAKYH